LLAIALPISIAGTSLLLFPLLVVWILGARWTFPRWPWIPGPADGAFAALVIVSVLSSLLGMAPAHSLKEIEKDFYYLMAPMCVALLADEERRASVLRAFLMAGLFTALVGAMQYCIGINKWYGQTYAYI